MSKIGINYFVGYPDRNLLIRILRGMNKSRGHLAMTGGNEPAKERQDVIEIINQVGNPNTLHFHRLFRREEGDWSKLTPEMFRDVLRAMAKHPQVVTEVLSNEPGNTDNAEFVANQRQCLAYAQELGHSVALGVWGVGGPSEHAIMNGTYKALYTDIQNANKKRQYSAFLNKHEYFYVWSECGAGFDDIPYEVLLDPATLRNHWKPKSEWTIRKGRWLIRRSDWEAVYCIENGIDPNYVPIFFSEYGWDGVDNPITYLNHIVKAPGQTPQAWIDNFGLNQNSTNTGFADLLRDKYIVYPYNGLRGVGSQVNIGKAIYPELSFPQYAEKILRHHNDDILHPAHIFGAAVFVVSEIKPWGGPKNTSGHNYIQAGLDDTLIIVGQLPDPTPLGTTPTPPPDPDPIPPQPELKPIRMQGYDNAAGVPVRVNLRATPSTSAAVLGELPAAPTITEGWISIAEPTAADGWIWAYVEFGTLKGWLAMSFVRQDNDIPPPVIVDDPRVPLLLALVKAQHAALVAIRQWLIDDIGEGSTKILFIDEVIGQGEDVA